MQSLFLENLVYQRAQNLEDFSQHPCYWCCGSLGEDQQYRTILPTVAMYVTLWITQKKIFVPDELKCQDRVEKDVSKTFSKRGGSIKEQVKRQFPLSVQRLVEMTAVLALSICSMGGLGKKLKLMQCMSNLSVDKSRHLDHDTMQWNTSV